MARLSSIRVLNLNTVQPKEPALELKVTPMRSICEQPDHWNPSNTHHRSNNPPSLF
jgi:hypothetical protein